MSSNHKNNLLEITRVSVGCQYSFENEMTNHLTSRDFIRESSINFLQLFQFEYGYYFIHSNCLTHPAQK